MLVSKTRIHPYIVKQKNRRYILVGAAGASPRVLQTGLSELKCTCVTFLMPKHCDEEMAKKREYFVDVFLLPYEFCRATQWLAGNLVLKMVVQQMILQSLKQCIFVCLS